jgi:hypothetical protein
MLSKPVVQNWMEPPFAQTSPLLPPQLVNPLPPLLLPLLPPLGGLTPLLVPVLPHALEHEPCAHESRLVTHCSQLDVMLLSHPW